MLKGPVTMRCSTFFKISHCPEISKTITHSTFLEFLLKTLCSPSLRISPDSAKIFFFLGCLAEAEKFHEISAHCFDVNKIIDPRGHAQYRRLNIYNHLDKKAFAEFLQCHPDQNEICKNSGLILGTNDTVFIGLPKLLTKKQEVDGDLWVHKISNGMRAKEDELISTSLSVLNSL